MHTTFRNSGPNCWITKAKLRETLCNIVKHKVGSGSDGICFSELATRGRRYLRSVFRKSKPSKTGVCQQSLQTVEPTIQSNWTLHSLWIDASTLRTNKKSLHATLAFTTLLPRCFSHLHTVVNSTEPLES